MRNTFCLFLAGLVILVAAPCTAGLIVSTGNPDGRIATASRPAAGSFEIESADDFILSSSAIINHATFMGLIPVGVAVSDVSQVVVEIYRVFPNDSVNPPSGNVPTRANSPSDVAFDSRDSGAATLSFTATSEGPFSVLNSVQPGGIHPKPGQTTGGNGPVSGTEVLFDVGFTTPFILPADHYFFIPQVELSTGNFLWLSAPKPIVAPGTPFAPDLQSWTRDANLDPDWLRVGMDIVGPPPQGGPAPAFNGVFNLDGELVPEPSSLALVLGGLGILGWRRLRPTRSQL